MSIALEKRGGIARSGLLRRPACFPIYEVPEPAARLAVPGDGGEDSCSSSSVGRNSDLSAGGSGSDGGEAEVQSRLKGPLETMDALEDSLPSRYPSSSMQEFLHYIKAMWFIESACLDFSLFSLCRRGISNFYTGKSKSFTSLVDATSSSSCKDLAKSENAYTRKRKNLLAFSVLSDKSSNLGNMEGRISKRPASSSRSMLSPSLNSTSSSSNSFSSEEDNVPARLLPPPHQQGKYSGGATSATAVSLSVTPVGSSRPDFSFPTRSFSLTDLHGIIHIQTRDDHKKNQ
ncbi:hypothetical protein B296_00058099 [Ensete ventricosum]|uniref:Uncharacterized protein n=1 Tax=Ensete ventricosum TaxID=4639 RepID=A0A426XNN8_ENSVE|nr:hypothetical protein B296_00058099 [Ensete ventricosum]